MVVRAKLRSTKWKELREWGGLVLGILGTVIAVVSFREAEKNAAVTTQIAVANRDIEVEKLLDEAWDLMGGRTGATYIDHVSQNPADLELARRRIDAALVKDQNSATAFRFRGVYFEAVGDFDRSIKSFEQSLERDASVVGTYVNLGLAYSAKGNQQKAIQALRKAEALDPTNPFVAHDLAGIYARCGLSVEAAAARTRVLQLLKAQKTRPNNSLLAVLSNASNSGVHLPRTSSNLALLAVIGILALAGAVAVRVIVWRSF